MSTGTSLDMALATVTGTPDRRAAAGGRGLEQPGKKMTNPAPRRPIHLSRNINLRILPNEKARPEAVSSIHAALWERYQNRRFEGEYQLLFLSVADRTTAAHTATLSLQYALT